MEPATSQIERIARDVIARSARAGSNGAGDAERLVAEVLRRIELERSVAGAEPGRKGAGDREEAASVRQCPGGAEPPGHRQGSAPATVVELQDRVITLKELDGKLGKAKQITVPRRAVITPAARDELARRGIAIGYAIAVQQSKPRATVAWGQAETNYEAARLLAALARERISVEPLAQTGLAQVIDELGDEITKGGKPAVLLTAKAAVALCLANRRRGVRAVMAQSFATTLQAVRAVGANLLVVDPASRSWFELKRLVGGYVAGAPYSCPAEYRGQLD
ncbi:MAG TPA: hypothetical protein VFW87_26440 [Pirellulales bacterium]|nr:hypothetical protein [Pirellulales bacterium]